MNSQDKIEELERALRSIVRDKAKSANVPPSLHENIIRNIEEQK